MTNPNHDPEDRELVTLRCPCDNPQPCCSESITSPKGLITILIWQCQAFTEDELDEDFIAFYDTLKGAFDEASDTP